jgi:hypothetical protein
MLIRVLAIIAIYSVASAVAIAENSQANTASLMVKNLLLPLALPMDLKRDQQRTMQPQQFANTWNMESFRLPSIQRHCS